jgi:hypothetical protein
MFCNGSNDSRHISFLSCSMMNVEDILQDSFACIIGETPTDQSEEGVVRYGPLKLRVAPKVYRH